MKRDYGFRLPNANASAFRRWYSIMALAFMMSCVTASCGSDEPEVKEDPDGVPEKLIGTWGMTSYLDDPSKYDDLKAIRFNLNGTGCRGRYILMEKTFAEGATSLTYTVSDHRISLNYVNSGECYNYNYKFKGSRLYLTLEGSSTEVEYMKL